MSTNTLVISGGSIGIGLPEGEGPTAKLDVRGRIKAQGLVESTVGGIKYPDGTIQITAGPGSSTITSYVIAAIQRSWFLSNI